MLGSYVAGRYSATFGAADIGQSEDGFELEFSFKQELIDKTDAYARTIIDMIGQGCDTYVSANLIEWIPGSKALLWAYGGGVMGKIFSVAAPPAVFASNLASAFVMTSTANTTAASNPATLTGSKAFPAPNFNPKILCDSRLRKLPIRLILLPYQSSSDLISFSTS